MKAIIPVAGVGTRLRPHTHTAPKVLLPVAGKPIMGHILDELVELGITEVTFIIGYKGEMIRDYVNNTYKFRANFVEQAEALGLGHAISLAKPHHDTDEPVVIILGDTIFKADLRSVFSRKHTAIGVREVEDGRRFGIVELNPDGSVKSLVEKPENPPTNLAIVGIYHITSPRLLFSCLDDIISRNQRTRGEFQLTDALAGMLARGERMEVFKIDGWYDCGKPETMLETNRYLLEMSAQANGGAQLHQSGSLIIPPVAIHPSVELSNSIVGPYVSISANARIADSVVRNSIVGEGAEVSSMLLEDSLISDNARVVGTSHRLNVGDSSEIIIG